MQIHLPAIDAKEAKQLIKRISTVLEQVHLSVNDWRQMLETLDTAVDGLKKQDAQAQA